MKRYTRPYDMGDAMRDSFKGKALTQTESTAKKRLFHISGI